MERLADVTNRALESQHALDFVKWLSCLHVHHGDREAATDLFLDRWPKSLSRDLVTKTIGVYQKAAVGAATTDDPSWAGVLTHDPLAAAFYDVAKRASLLGKIPGLRQIPFHVRVPTLSTDANYVWVGEHSLKPVSRFSFDDGVVLGLTKILGIVVVSNELARLGPAGLEGVFRDLLINGLTAFTDRQFIDPAVGVVPDVRPPSITNGVAPTTGTGDLLEDIGTLIGALYAGRPSAESAVLIMAPGTAAQLTAQGVPLGASVVTSPAAAGIMVALDPSGVFVADNGIAFDVSDQALLELSDAPVGTAAAVLTSLWQTNLAGYKVERFVNWQALAGAVQYLVVA